VVGSTLLFSFGLLFLRPRKDDNMISYQPQHRLDFGPPATVGAHLRRRGKTFSQYDIQHDFGVWLGERPVTLVDECGQHHTQLVDEHGDLMPVGTLCVVGIKRPDCSISYCLLYDKMEDVREEWELD
jgi:hypothetical protein